MPPQLNLFTSDPPAESEPLGGRPIPVPITPSSVRVPISLEHCPEHIDELKKLIDGVWAKTHDHDLWGRCCEVWLATLRRFEPGGEADYLEAIEPWKDNPKVLNLVAQAFGILVQHFWHRGYFCDLLGPVYEEVHREIRGARWLQENGTFFTPWDMARMIAKQSLGDLSKDEEKRLEEGPAITVNDPACGSAVMLLAARSVIAEKYGRGALRYLHVSGQDIDRTCWAMASIQTRMSDDRWMTSFMLASAPEIAQGRGAA